MNTIQLFVLSEEQHSLISVVDPDAEREIEWNRPKKDLISLKRLIGCTYTCAIAPADTRNRKMDILGESEDWFKKIHEKMESWRINVNPKVLDKSYIYGLYESNMGALHMQYVDNGCEEHLDEALRRYKKKFAIQRAPYG